MRATENSPICLSRGFSNGVPTYAETPLRSTDFDGDGRADLFITGGNPPNRQRLVYVRPGATADAVIYESVSMATIGLGTDEMASSAANTEKLVQWLDLNGDGLEDFVFAQTNGTGSVPSYQWVVRLNKGGILSAAIATGNATGLGTWGNAASGLPPVGPRFRYSGKIAPVDVDSDGRQELLVPVRIGAMYCSSYTEPPPQGTECPIPPASESAQPDGDLPPCLTVRLCPIDPVSGAEIVPTVINEVYSLYGRGSPGPTLDQSTYVMHPLRFVVGAVDTATGLPRITVQEVQKDLYGNHVDDMYGDGLSDVVASVGCQWTDCSPVANGATPNTPSTLPDGTSVASLAGGRKLFINENAGIGTQQARPPELMHTAFNGLDDWAEWSYLPLAAPTVTSAAIPLPLYSLPSSNPYVDDRHYYFTSSMPVVHIMTQSNGVGADNGALVASGARNRSFSYQEAMYNRFGRGFQGFRKITETTLLDSAMAGRRQQVVTTYHQKFPLTGKIEFVTSADPVHPGSPYRRETFAWRCNRANRSENCPGVGRAPLSVLPNTIYSPYLDTQRVENFDLARAEAGSSVLVNRVNTVNANDPTTSGWDSYGNLRNQVVTSQDVGGSGAFVASHTAETLAVYTSDESNWWLDRLDSETVTTAISYAKTHALPPGTEAPLRTVSTKYQWGDDRLLYLKTVQDDVPGQELRTTYYRDRPLNYGLLLGIATGGDNVLRSRLVGMQYTKDGTTYARDGYFVWRTSDALGRFTFTERRPGDGAVTRTIDRLNLKTINTYDAFGRVIRTDYLDANDAAMMPPRYTSWTRCSNGSCPGGYGEGTGEALAAYRVTATQAGYPIEVTWYDKLDRVVKTSRSGFNPDSSTAPKMTQTLTEYDAAGALKRTSAPHYPIDPPYWTTFDQYDRLGRLLQKTAPAAELDASAGDVRTTYVYSDTSAAIKVRGTGTPTACSSNTNLCMDMTRTYDVLGRLQQTTQSNGTTANYAVTDYWYDGSGNPVAARDAEGHVLKAFYNDVGQRTQIVDPDAGTWNFTYDALGQMLTQADGRGVTATQAYDWFGHMIDRIVRNPNSADPNLKAIRDIWQYHGSPGYTVQLQTVYRSTGTATDRMREIWRQDYAYDSATQRLSETATTMRDAGANQTLFTTSYAYDDNGHESIVTYPNGLAIGKDYTPYGELNQLSANGAPVWNATAMDAWGHVVAESYANGLSGVHVAYPATGQLKQQRWMSGGSLRAQLDYTYDSFANLKTQSTAYAAGTAKETYFYDALQRLVRTTRTGVPGNPPTVSYQYSPSGNLLSKSDYSTSATGAYQYGGNGCGPHGVSQVAGLTGTLTYQCDANGNVVGGNTLTGGVYDFQNLPWSIGRIGAGTAVYAYGSNGQRFSETAPQHSTWLGERGFERSVTPSQSLDRVELGPVTVTQAGGGAFEVRPNLRDRLGSTIAVGNTNGSLWQTRGYDAFGKARNGDYSDRPNGTLDLLGPTLRGFTGHEHVDDVRLIHMNGRMYDYQLGRFLSADPIVQNPANSQSLNPYSYLMNNPFSGRDPSGYACDQKMTGTNICGVDTGAQNGRSSETKTVTDAQSGQKTTYTRSIAANGTKVYVQVSSSGARTGSGTKPVGQTDGSKSGAAGIDDVERDPGQQGLQRAAEFGKAFGEAGENVLNAVNPGDPTNLVGGMLVGKAVRLGKGLVERGLDEVTQRLLGEKAAQEGIEAVVARFWTRNEVNGVRVYQRSDLIDPAMVDRFGRTNLELMRMGYAPFGPDGRQINLHHMTQSADSSLAEVTQTFHREYSKVLHINPSTTPSGIDRSAFDKVRSQYWTERAKDFDR